ncbi:hypothetical protein IH980_01750 [Patescibacteria group bacterium]|nr:hypothetical protein [Patescibacteria group bacterium]
MASDPECQGGNTAGSDGAQPELPGVPGSDDRRDPLRLTDSFASRPEWDRLVRVEGKGTVSDCLCRLILVDGWLMEKLRASKRMK